MFHRGVVCMNMQKTTQGLFFVKIGKITQADVKLAGFFWLIGLAIP
jgi:hypothetical protein